MAIEATWVILLHLAAQQLQEIGVFCSDVAIWPNIMYRKSGRCVCLVHVILSCAWILFEWFEIIKLDALFIYEISQPFFFLFFFVFFLFQCELVCFMSFLALVGVCCHLFLSSQASLLVLLVHFSDYWVACCLSWSQIGQSTQTRYSCVRLLWQAYKLGHVLNRALSG